MKKKPLPLQFIQTSYSIGSNHLLVQGAGGNTSYKEEEEMWIKASGKWLSKARDEDIFVQVDLQQTRAAIDKNQEIPLMKESSLRPSIETTLHALMPHKIVLHAHPVDMLAWLVRKDAENILENILCGINWTWISYARPGYNLTLTVKNIIKNKSLDVLVLGNHGVIVGSKNSHDASKLMNHVVNRCKQTPRNFIAPNNKKIKQLARELNMRIPNYEIIQSLAFDKTSFDYCNQKNGILYPDQAVFLGNKMPCLINGTFKKNKIKSSSSFLILEGLGVVIALKTKKDVDEILRCHAEVLLRLKPNLNLRYLSNSEVDKLLDWDAEKYRLSLRK